MQPMTIPVMVVMGSKSDWETMQHTSTTLDTLKVKHKCEVVSAHRTPGKMVNFAQSARAQGFQVIIAGAGGAAHLPGMIASMTSLPVIGVPIQSKALNGLDSLLSIAQMPKGVSVATMSIGDSGAVNAAITAASILSLHDDVIYDALETYRNDQTAKVLEDATLP